MCPRGQGELVGAGRLGMGEAREEQEEAWGSAVQDRSINTPVLKGERLWRPRKAEGKAPGGENMKGNSWGGEGREVPSSGTKKARVS